MSLPIYLNVEVQSANIDEDAGLKVEKSNPVRLVQVVSLLKAGKGDVASFILQHFPDYLNVDLLVHCAIAASAEELCMHCCCCLTKGTTLGNCLGKNL